MTDSDPTAKLLAMDPCASAGKKPVTEETLHSLGWTFHEATQTWNFHGIKHPCLSRKPVLLEEVLWSMHSALSKSMGNIENNMRAMGVNVPEVVKAQRPESDPVPPRVPGSGAPTELHEFLDAVVDAARKQGARVQISVDPNPGFNPVSALEQMLAGRCPHCRGQHG